MDEKKGLLAKICKGIKKYKKEIFIGVVASGVISLIPYYCHLSNLYRERIEILNQQIGLLKVKEAEQEPNALIADTRELLFKTQGKIKENNEKYLSIIEKSNELINFNEALAYELKVVSDFSIASQIRLLKDNSNYELIFFKSGFKEASSNIENFIEKAERYTTKEIKDRVLEKEPWGIYGDFNRDGLEDIVIHDYIKKHRMIVKDEKGNISETEYIVADSDCFTEVILVRYGLPDGNFGFLEKMPHEIYKSVWESEIFKEKNVLSY